MALSEQSRSIHPDKRLPDRSKPVEDAVPTLHEEKAHNEPLYNPDTTFALWYEIKERNRIQMPHEALVTTQQRLEQAYEHYENGLPPGEERQGAFFIQSRDSLGFNFGDVGSHLPALEYVSPQERELLVATLPPIELATVELGNPDTLGSIVNVPLTIEGLMEHSKKGMGAMVKGYARPRITDAARFAYENLGVKAIGLGETMAAMSKYGQTIEQEVPGLYVTTGHGYTTYLLEETAREAARQAGIALEDERVGIIGCGSIGRAMALKLASENVRQFVLSDIDMRVAKALQATLQEQHENIDVIIANSNKEACENSLFLIGAASSHRPILNGEIQPGTIFIDDSQPPMVERDHLSKKSGVYVWPIAQAPNSIQRVGYNYGPNGLLPGTEWGCGGELWTLLMSNTLIENRINRAVTPDMVNNIGRLAASVGFRLSDPLQSYGVPVSPEQFQKARDRRRKAGNTIFLNS